MVTTIERPEVRTQAGSGTGYGHCEGCPRCENPDAPLCSYNHRQFNGLHPVCKVCGHCVLRGEHMDDGDDLDDLAYNIGGGRGRQGYSLN